MQLFGIRHIVFVMYQDITYMLVHSKVIESKKTKMSYNLNGGNNFWIVVFFFHHNISVARK